MTLIRWSPFFEPFEDMDKFLTGNMAATASFVPALDVYQDKSNVVVEAPLPHIKPENLKVTIENDVLTIEGNTEKSSEVDDKNYYRKEVRYGSFHRSLALPVSVNGDAAKAEYEEGMLKITIPKEEKTKSKAVEVEIKKKDNK